MDLLLAFAISLGLNVLLFIPAYLLQTDKLTDFSYGLTFIVLAVLAVWGDFLIPKELLVLMIIVWGLRLSGYLLIRIRKIKKDKRFDGMRESFWRFLRFWALQGLAVWVIMLAALFYLDGPIVGGALVWLGFFIWLSGLLFETIADYQKYTFIQDKRNKGAWIDTGLWRYSRHPNYFGEILVWVGVYVFAFNSLTGWELLIGLASPVFIILLLIFVSGLPQLEKSADKKWGHNAAYRKYKRETSVLVPWFRG